MNNIEITALINDYVMPWGIKIALSIIIFYVGRMVVSLVVGSVGKLLASRGMDEILIGFLTSIMRWVLLLFVIVAAPQSAGSRHYVTGRTARRRGTGHWLITAIIPVKLRLRGDAYHLSTYHQG